MATLADSLVSSASRPLALRMRPDLTARQQRYQGRTYWVVKEPVGLNYYRFHEEEYAILCMLDGHTSLEQIKEEFEQRFTPQKVTYQDLQQFIGMLHRSGLVISNAPRQGIQLRKRRDQKKRREWLGRLSNVFAIRWRGIDPERILNAIYPYTRWFFQPPMMVFIALLAISALLLVSVQFDVFRSRLPTFQEFFFGYKNWLYLLVVMAVAKVLHEFGHGLSCKHFGGECHEMGFMLLVFTPALYCNVSDSWMLPNKWHRVFIGAAGMYVEIFLASVATFIWWFSDPTTLVNQLALRVMFICSVSTILFNGNPLLRFDGYYILMDILEIPNLRQKSTEILKRFMVDLCLGIEQPENPFLPQENRFWFGMYTIAAVIYRWIVVLSILLFLNKVLEPYGLQVIGRIIGAIGFFGLVVQPLYQLGKFFYIPGRMHKVKRHRVAISLAVVVLLIAGVWFVPLPYHVECSFNVKPGDAATVYAAVPGRLAEVRAIPGKWVEKDFVLAKLENANLQIEVLDLERRVRELEIELTSIWRQARHRKTAALRVKEIREQLEAFSKQLEAKRIELAELEVRAPVSGIVFPVADRRDTASEGELATWSGSLLEPRNVGAFLQPSDAICQVGNPKRLYAELLIDQSVIELVQKGHAVELMFEAYSGEVYDSKIEKVSLPQVQATPLSLSAAAGGEVNTKTDKSGRMKPLSTTYPALAPLPDGLSGLRVGMRGRAKVYTGWQPLGWRLYRFVARTFHFEL